MANPSSSGLEGIVVAHTLISDVDGERGRLVIAGRDVEDLAGSESFESAAARVLAAGAGTSFGPSTPSPAPLALGPARAAAWQLVPRLGNALAQPDGMDALRASLAHLVAVGHANETGKINEADDRSDALAALGAAPVFVAAWNRTRLGFAPIAPDPSLGHAADYLRMSTGSTPTAEQARALDAYLTTVSDHATNASTFTARVIASTASDMISALVGGVGALKGPLHGGAPGPVLDMLDAISEPANAETWLLDALAAGHRIMGMGHRIYRVRDPRAAVLETAVRPLASPRLLLARAVETAATKILREKKPDRPLAANVEFYTAVLLDAVGLPREQFAATFATARIAGWAAHVIEQRRVGKLIRPASEYVGETT
ncbi:MAG TPA: citrate synthase [Kofleriaceae bacterium]|jgi:citrate synthase